MKYSIELVLAISTLVGFEVESYLLTEVIRHKDSSGIAHHHTSMIGRTSVEISLTFGKMKL